jgi:alanine racemase
MLIELPTTMLATSPNSFNYPCVEINLDNVLHNLNQIRTTLPPSTSMGIMAVVKDNAYGCGSVMISRVLENNGVRFFIVAKTCEARILREGGVTSPILVLGPALTEELRWGTAAGIRFSLNDLADLAAWTALNIPLRFHVNIDTGMGRLGLAPEETGSLAAKLLEHPLLTCEGAYTHCARADDPDSQATDSQLAHFKKVLDDLSVQGLRPPLIHYANSAAVMRHRTNHCTMIRPGVALYGCKPDPAQDFNLDLRPVLCLKANVIKIKRVIAGAAISYGGTYITASDTTIATIGLGYGQGLPRQLGNRGEVLIGGRRLKIAGKVTMDYVMVDAGPNPAFDIGAEVVAIGNQGKDCIRPDDIALLCNTIGYEILCSVNSRLDRYYIFEGKIIHHEPCIPF